MKQTVRVVSILDLDEDSVELTCNSITTKKAGFNLEKIMGGDMGHLRQEMVQNMPKMFKVVVSYAFYKENDINIRKMVDIEVTI